MGAIVLSMHDGAVAGGDFNSGANPSGPALDLALRVSPDIDAIVTGHWHTRFTMMLPDPNGVPRPFVEAGCYGQVINEINLRLDPLTGRVVRELTVSTNHPNTRDIAPHPELKEVVDYWAGQAAERDRSRIGRQTGTATRSTSAAVTGWRLPRTRSSRATATRRCPSTRSPTGTSATSRASWRTSARRGC
ncbi:hypothetical protein ACFWP3_24215 [Streptomyces sp. NPDC058525]|uniref:hypothetical protein n=1 Tax=Streptomyces sp. NPDC058525 TaxID=3346538 RepID=UPI003648989E